MIIHKSWVINLVSTSVVAVTCLMGDKRLQSTTNPMTKAIIDNATHGLIGLFSAIVVLSDHYDKLHLALACMMMSSLVDADHFITARSLKLSVSSMRSVDYTILIRFSSFLGSNKFNFATVSSQLQHSTSAFHCSCFYPLHVKKSFESHFMAYYRGCCICYSSLARCQSTRAVVCPFRKHAGVER